MNRNPTRKLLTGAFALTAAAVLTAPAVAADTSTTFEVTDDGDLTISIPVSADLGTVGSQGSLAAPLGEVVVTDDRAQLTKSWSVTVDATDFTADVGEAEPAVVAPAELTYDPEAIGAITGNLTGGVLVATPRTLDSAEPVVTFESVDLVVLSGDAAWTPEIQFDPDGQVPAGEYSGTITHNLLQ